MPLRAFDGSVGLRVNAVQPGVIETPLVAMPDEPRQFLESKYAMKRFGRPEEVAAVVLGRGIVRHRRWIPRGRWLHRAVVRRDEFPPSCAIAARTQFLRVAVLTIGSRTIKHRESRAKERSVQNRQT
jgi:hypothetical protein